MIFKRKGQYDSMWAFDLTETFKWRIVCLVFWQMKDKNWSNASKGRVWIFNDIQRTNTGTMWNIFFIFSILISILKQKKFNAVVIFGFI